MVQSSTVVQEHTVKREIVYALGKHGEVKGPLPSQKRFHALPDRFKLYSGAVGSGKSCALCHEAIKKSYQNPGLLGLIGAPTYRLLMDVTQKAFFEILDNSEIPYHYHISDKICTMKDTGSEIIFRSMDDPDSLRGTNLAWFAIDEMTFCEAGAFERLQARLRHPHADYLCGFGACTPNGYNWVYNKFVGPEKIFNAVLAPAGENKTVVDTGMYEALAISYDERFYRQEVLGEYLSVFSGQVFHAFDRAKHCEPLAYRPHLELGWALDFNLDYMSSVIFQIVPATYSTPVAINVLDEIRFSQKGTKTSVPPRFTCVRNSCCSFVTCERMASMLPNAFFISAQRSLSSR